jgi:hypothetical protein
MVRAAGKNGLTVKALCDMHTDPATWISWKQGVRLRLCDRVRIRDCLLELHIDFSDILADFFTDISHASHYRNMTDVKPHSTPTLLTGFIPMSLITLLVAILVPWPWQVSSLAHCYRQFAAKSYLELGQTQINITVIHLYNKSIPRYMHKQIQTGQHLAENAYTSK